MSSKPDVENVPAGSVVELFISPDCPYCRRAMAYYDSVGTRYAARDAQNDLEQRRRMFDYTGGDPTVPAIVIDGDYVQSGWGHPPHG